MNYDVSDFLEDLLAAFYEPNHKTEESKGRWLALVKRKLQHFDADTLREAAEYLQTHRKAKSFPSLAEMINACEKHAPRDKARPEVQAQSWQTGDACKQYLAGERLFEDLLLSGQHRELFRRAAKDDWASALREFVIKHQRLPEDGKEESRCIASAYQFLQAYEDCVRGGFTFAKALENLGDSMLKRRAELNERILKHGS